MRTYTKDTRFRAGDKVRLARISPDSTLSHNHILGIGWVGTVSEINSDGTLSFREVHLNFYADQFELVEEPKNARPFKMGDKVRVTNLLEGSQLRHHAHIGDVLYVTGTFSPVGSGGMLVSLAMAPGGVSFGDTTARHFLASQVELVETKVYEIPPDAKTMLDMIDRFLARDNQPASDLQRVLSAIRGPDDGNIVLKEVTTGPIRRAALPNTCGTALDYGAVNMSFVSHGFDQLGLGIAQAHFMDHARWAVEALERMGIKVERKKRGY